jgi:hypothetical protein
MPPHPTPEGEPQAPRRPTRERRSEATRARVRREPGLRAARPSHQPARERRQARRVAARMEPPAEGSTRERPAPRERPGRARPTPGPGPRELPRKPRAAPVRRLAAGLVHPTMGRARRPELNPAPANPRLARHRERRCPAGFPTTLQARPVRELVLAAERAELPTTEPASRLAMRADPSRRHSPAVSPLPIREGVASPRSERSSPDGPAPAAPRSRPHRPSGWMEPRAGPAAPTSCSCGGGGASSDREPRRGWRTRRGGCRPAAVIRQTCVTLKYAIGVTIRRAA